MTEQVGRKSEREKGEGGGRRAEGGGWRVEEDEGDLKPQKLF